MWYLHLLILCVGFLILAKGADYFVEASSSIAKRLGISKFVIGLTLVAVGTSIPELASSVIAAINEHPDLILGNVIGSNIANIGLVIGISASIANIKTRGRLLKQNGYIMLLATFLFSIFAFRGIISNGEALIFLILYSFYLIFLLYVNSNPKNNSQPHDESRIYFPGGLTGDFLVFLGGGVAVIIGGHLLVKEAVWFANFLKVPENIIGLSMVAVGTSLPELGVSISAVKKGYGSMLVGNIIGSNIANIFLVLGVSALINPLRITDSTIVFLIPFLSIITFTFLFFIIKSWEIKRREGISLLIIYSLFIIFVFVFQLT